MKIQELATFLENSVDENRFVDVGRGAEKLLGVSHFKLNQAVRLLQFRGYSVNVIKYKKLDSALSTIVKVLGPPKTDFVTA